MTKNLSRKLAHQLRISGYWDEAFRCLMFLQRVHLIPAKGTELAHASWIKTRQRLLILLSYMKWRSDDAQLSSFAKSDNYNYKCLCKRSRFLPTDWQLPSGFACINPFCMQTPQIKKKVFLQKFWICKSCKNWFVSLLSFAPLTIKIANKKRGIQFNKVLWKR